MSLQSDLISPFLGNPRDQNWVNTMKERYQTPERYKQHLKEQENAHWKQAKTGGINERMSILEAQRKKRVEEEKQLEEEK